MRAETLTVREQLRRAQDAIPEQGAAVRRRWDCVGGSYHVAAIADPSEIATQEIATVGPAISGTLQLLSPGQLAHARRTGRVPPRWIAASTASSGRER
eukprot:gene44213-34720_t